MNGLVHAAGGGKGNLHREFLVLCGRRLAFNGRNAVRDLAVATATIQAEWQDQASKPSGLTSNVAWPGGEERAKITSSPLQGPTITRFGSCLDVAPTFNAREV